MTRLSDSDILIARTLKIYHFHPENMIGPAARKDRQLIISAVRGFSVALAKSGVNHMIECLKQHCIPTDELRYYNCEAAKYKAIGDWAKDVLVELGERDPAGYNPGIEDLN